MSTRSSKPEADSVGDDCACRCNDDSRAQQVNNQQWDDIAGGALKLTDVDGHQRVVRFDDAKNIVEVDNPDGSSWVKKQDGSWDVIYADGHKDLMLPAVKITIDDAHTITVRNTANGDNQIYREDGSKTYNIVNADGTVIRREFDEHGHQARDVIDHPTSDRPGSDQPSSDTLWDPRLDELNAGIEHPQGLQPGQRYWKLVQAEFMSEGNDPGQSQGRHHIYYLVLDENGQPINNAQITQGWPDGTASAATKPEDGGVGNIPMFAGFDPAAGQAGPYSAWVSEGGLPSDKMTGMGLPYKHHVSYQLTYQLATWMGEQEQPAAPVPEQPAIDMSPHMVAPDGRRTDQHPDINLRYRGYQPVQAPHTLVDYGGPTDDRAPQLAGLFRREHGFPEIVNTYSVNDWNWGSNSRGGPIHQYPVTMIGFGTHAGESIHVPNSGYRIAGNYQAEVLFVDQDSVVINYTNNGWIPHGYTIHIEGIRPNSYLHEGQFVVGWERLGTAIGNEVKVAIRDTGSFMDPRTRKDWWTDDRQP